MDTVHKKTLKKNRYYLVTNLHVDTSLLAYLISHDILDDGDEDIIKQHNTMQDKVSELCKMLLRKGPHAFHVFLEALKETHRDYIAEKLQKDTLTLSAVMVQEAPDNDEQMCKDASATPDTSEVVPNHQDNTKTETGVEMFANASSLQVTELDADMTDGATSLQMDPIHVDVIKRETSYLLENLTISIPFLEQFVPKRIISSDDMNSFMMTLTERDKVLRFCDIILTKGPEAFSTLLDALTASNQDHVKVYLERSLRQSDPTSQEVSVPVEGAMATETKHMNVNKLKNAGRKKATNHGEQDKTTDNSVNITHHKTSTTSVGMDDQTEDTLTTEISSLCISGSNVNSSDSMGRTGLHQAARRGRLGDVKSLVSAGANVNARDDSDRTPLHDACWFNKSKTVETLVSLGADIDAQDAYGCAPIHYACRWGYPNVVRTLRRLKARTNIRDLANNTPRDWVHQRANKGKPGVDYDAILKILPR